MLSPNLTLTAPAIDLSPTILTRQWQIGQVLNAIVVSSSDAGEPVLKIDGQTLKASSPQQLKEGELLKVQVLDTSSRPLLKLIAHTKPATLTERLEFQLRQDLPRQQKLSLVTNKLLQISNNIPLQNTSNEVPGRLSHQIDETVRLLPRLIDLTKLAGLKKAIADSGLFMESKILQSLSQPMPPAGKLPSPVLTSDLKAGLLRLENVVTQELKGRPERNQADIQAPRARNENIPVKMVSEQTITQPESDNRVELAALKTVLNSAVAKIQVNQGQTIISHEQSTPQWIIDLPFTDNKRAGLLELLIGRESVDPAADNQDKAWSVRLQLDLRSLGKVTIMLKLKQGHLNSIIWAEQESSNTKIKTQLGKLNQDLHNAGFHSVSLQQRPLAPEQANRDINLPSLVETRI